VQSNSYSPIAGDLVSFTSDNGRIRMCARVMDDAQAHRPAQAGMVWIRETGLSVVGDPWIVEARPENLRLEARQ
jgi:hypothetical protein